MRFCLLMTAACVLAYAQPPRSRRDERAPASPETIEAGRKRFLAVCSGCHGQNGEGGRGPNLSEGRAVRRMRDDQLFTAIQKGVPGTDMPPTPVPDDQIRQLVAFVRSLGSPAFETGVSGNVQNGSEIFHGKGGCDKCHMIKGQGGYLGPDLTNIGMLRPARLLREAVAAPSARLAEGFQGVTVTMLDGATVKGVAKDNTNYAIQVLDAAGELHLLDKTKVREVVFRKKSVMPDDYSKRLTRAELDDVAAFLSRQAVREPAAQAARR
jgi:cytochrome c oxidase cbb3-type subunit III